MNECEHIQQQVNDVYRTEKRASLHIRHKGVADIKVEVKEIQEMLIFRNSIQMQDQDLHFDLERSEPLVMMYFQLKGRTNFIDSKPFIIPALHHSLNYIPSFKSQCLAEKNSDVQTLCIKIRPSLLLEDTAMQVYNDAWLLSLEKGEPLITLHESQLMNVNMRNNLQQLMQCPFSGLLGSSYRQSLIRLLLLQQLAEFGVKDPVDAREEYQFEEPQPNKPKQNSKLSANDITALHDLRKYLEDNYLEDFSIETLARKAGLNSFKVKHGFKKLFNTSAIRFIDEMKMNHARNLILDGHSTDRFELSDKLGYNHYSNFSAAFKKHFGQSPSMYKKYFSHNN